MRENIPGIREEKAVFPFLLQRKVTVTMSVLYCKQKP